MPSSLSSLKATKKEYRHHPSHSLMTMMHHFRSSFLLLSSLLLLFSAFAVGRVHGVDHPARVFQMTTNQTALQTSSGATGESSALFLSERSIGSGTVRLRLLAAAPTPAPGDDDSDSTWGEGESPAADSPPVVLAPRRTYRKDPLKGFRRYTGGWNITDPHYWASAGYTAAPFFVIAGAWFLIFGLCLCLSLCHCHCHRRSSSSPSPSPPPTETSKRARNTPSLPLLLFFVFFSVAAIIGCGVLYTGQQRFHSSTIKALEYIRHEADSTTGNLRNVSQYLSAAKLVNVDNNQVSLPPNVQTDVDQTRTNLDSAATVLAVTTRNTSQHIKHLIESVRLALFLLTAVLLLLTLLGLAFSILGMQLPVYILVITGWILVTGTFILCATFLLLHNVAGDTCAAMNQWVQNPAVHHQHTPLDDILGCLDNNTVQDTLSRTKQVTSQLVDLINTVITNVSNINFAPNFAPMYYNQSGPLVPTLCNPFQADLTTSRGCAAGEVDLNNATQVWSGYVCQTAPNGGNDVCVTTGRLNPRLYSEMAATVNVSTGLYQYGPVVAELEGCSFVRQTFSDIGTAYCPALTTYSRRTYLGLLMVGSAVMVSLLIWLIFGRERRIHHDKPTDGGIASEEEDRDDHHKQQHKYGRAQ